MTERLVIFADVAYRPLEYWAELWSVPATTIKTWLQKGLCPGKKIGGRWMISQMELLNWEPPAEPDESRQGRETSEGGRVVPNPKKRRVDSARPDVGRDPSVWPV